MFLGDRKLDQNFEIEHISLLIENLIDEYLTSNDKIPIIEIIIILKNTQSQHIYDIIENLMFEEMKKHIEKQTIGFKIENQNFANIAK